MSRACSWWTLLLTLATAVLVALPMTATAVRKGSGGPSPVFTRPKYQGYRLDWCLTWGQNCGQPVADRWCQKHGYTGASGWVREDDVGQTMILETGEVCQASFCDSFYSITCYHASLPNLAGDWICTKSCPAGGEGNIARIKQKGSQLHLTNEAGGTSEGRFEGSNTIVATQWGNLKGDIRDGGNAIHWRNETIWVRRPHTPQLGEVSEALCPDVVTLDNGRTYRRIGSRTTQGGAGFECQYGEPGRNPFAVIGFGFRRDPDRRSSFCHPASGPPFHNSRTHDLQVSVSLNVRPYDEVARRVLRAAEDAQIALPCPRP